MSTVSIRLTGKAADVAAARELLEEILGERLKLGQVTPDKRNQGDALVYGQLRVSSLAELAASEVIELMPDP
jgi:hypothetical protein